MINGSILIGGSEHAGAGTFAAIDTSSGATIAPRFAEAGPDDVANACALADDAFASFSETDLETRGKFLEAIADKIVEIRDDLIVRALQESGLSRGRIEGERGRTVGQLRLFAMPK